jgi:hypothetical protein
MGSDYGDDDNLDIPSEIGKINRALEIMNKQLQTISTITITLAKQAKQIEKLNLQNQALSKTVNEVKSENEFLQNEMKKINLVFSGVPEVRNETEVQMNKVINKIIHDITGSKLEIDTVFRIGKPRDKFNRPIKVRFTKMSDRNLVFEKRTGTTPPIYINEDLSYITRRDHGLLREKRKEFIAAGERYYRIDWNKKFITCNEQIFQIIDGVLIEQEQDASSIKQQPRLSNNNVTVRKPHSSKNWENPLQQRRQDSKNGSTQQRESVK